MPIGNPQTQGFNYPTYGPLQQLATFIGMPGVENVYNQQVSNAQAQQAAQEKVRQQDAMSQLVTQALGTRAGNVPSSAYVTPEMWDKVAPYIANQDFGGAQAQVNAGGIPTSYGMAPAAQTQQLGQNVQQRQYDVADNNATLGRMSQVTGPGGFNGNIPSPPQQLPPINPPGQPPTQPDSSGTIATGATQTYNPDPLGLGGIPNIPNMLTGYQDANTNRYQQGELSNTAYNNQTTRTHYGRADANDAIKAAADKERADKYQVYPPAGRAPTMLEQMSPEERAQYLQRQASGIAAPTLPTAAQYLQLQQLQNAATPSNGLFGLWAHGADPAAVANYNAVAPRYGRQQLPFANRPAGGFSSWKASKGAGR